MDSELMYHRATVLVLSGIFILTVTDLMVKTLSVQFPTTQIAFLRYAFGSVACIPLIASTKLRLPSLQTTIANGSRSVLVVMTTVSFFYALSVLPFAEAVTLSFAAPFFVIVFAKVFLGEPLGRAAITSVVIGFSGTIVIVGGSLGATDYDRVSAMGALAALASAVFYALNMVLLRQRAKTDSVTTIVTFQNVGPALILLWPALGGWVLPSGEALAMFALLGVLGLVSHLLLSMAYARAEASRLAPFEYTSLIWAAAFGYALFGEAVSGAAISGAVLIFVGTVIASRRN